MNKYLKLLLFPLFIAGRIAKAPFFFASIPNFKTWDSPFPDFILVGLYLCAIFAPVWVTLIYFVLFVGFWLAVLGVAIQEANKLIEDFENTEE